MRYRTQPPWEFLLSASRNSLQSFELSRLSHAANLRREIGELLDSWLEENAAALLARWLMEHGERPPEPLEGPEPGTESASEQRGNPDLRETASKHRAQRAQTVSDNIFADPAGPPPAMRFRS